MFGWGRSFLSQNPKLHWSSWGTTLNWKNNGKFSLSFFILFFTHWKKLKSKNSLRIQDDDIHTILNKGCCMKLIISGERRVAPLAVMHRALCIAVVIILQSQILSYTKEVKSMVVWKRINKRNWRESMHHYFCFKINSLKVKGNPAAAGWALEIKVHLIAWNK